MSLIAEVSAENARYTRPETEGEDTAILSATEMLTYADVICGRLLLNEGSVTLEILWRALARAAASAETLTDVLARGPLANPTGAEALGRALEASSLVQRVERDRFLARVVHDAGLASEERLRELYGRLRAKGYPRPLNVELIATGLLDSDQAERLMTHAEALLKASRLQRVETMRELAGSLAWSFLPEEAERVRKVFQLARPDSTPPTERYALSSRATGRLRQQDPPAPAIQPATPQGKGNKGSERTRRVLIEAPPGSEETSGGLLHGKRGGNLAPEDCPIYGYEIVEQLGKGAMGVVYRARHVLSGRMAALKILPLRLAEKTQYLERFKREAMALMRLEHENVVRAYDFGGSEEYYYLALEFVKGEPLHAILGREGQLSEVRALTITRQIASGLGAAAERGIVHRDIKPENVMLTKEGVAKICDFGIVKLTDLDEGMLTVVGTTVGTPFYISPEQARGEDDLDLRSDLYSLGISLFHLTTGQVPFTGKSQGAILVRHILEEVPDPRSVNPSLSEGLARIVRRLTRKKREERYPQVDELIADIDATLAGLGNSPD